MIDAIRATLSSLPVPQRLNGLREYLQWMVLQALDESGHRTPLIFTGGTCLRDVRPFLLNPDEERFLTKPLLLKALAQAKNQFS